LREAVSEISGGNVTIKQKLQHIGHKFICGTEISAQEAVYCCLGMPLSGSSSGEVFINTAKPEKRVRILKSREQLQNLPEDSVDIFVIGLAEHYIQRPDVLESLCLADFAAYYVFSKRHPRNSSERNPDDTEGDNEQSRFTESVIYALRDESGFIRKRLGPSIIRYRRFNINTERSDYFRELVMLYAPWRNEEVELLTRDCEAFCNINKDLIENNKL